MHESTLMAQIPEPVRGICKRLRETGKRAWVVGGCVRDLLRGVKVADYDICTDARPEETTRAFAKVIPTGIEHGTVSVLWKGAAYEVTTLRGETTYSDGRRPDAVVFHDDITADLARRDFTVNAIAIDPLDGAIIDPFEGRRDLAAKVIRAVGDARARFSEDGLRVLRAARFVATLGAELDPATEAAIEPSLDTYRKVSPERVRDEWVKTMKAKAPSRAFDVMRRTGVLGVSCPELVEGVGCAQGAGRRDVWGQAMAALDACEGDAILRVAALLLNVGKPRARAAGAAPGEYSFEGYERASAAIGEEVLKRLRFSNDERERVVAVVRGHNFGYDEGWPDAEVRRWVRRVGRERLDDLYRAARANAAGDGRPAEGELARIAHLAGRASAVLAAGDPLATKELAVNGRDLMAALALPPGRHVGELLERLLEAAIEDPSLNTRERLLERARALHAASASPAKA
jgi:tRNA nucleotidyltransferase (CCA-adding enzyme)